MRMLVLVFNELSVPWKIIGKRKNRDLGKEDEAKLSTNVVTFYSAARGRQRRAGECPWVDGRCLGFEVTKQSGEAPAPVGEALGKRAAQLCPAG